MFLFSINYWEGGAAPSGLRSFRWAPKEQEAIDEYIKYSEDCAAAYTERAKYLKEMKRAGKDSAEQNGLTYCMLPKIPKSKEKLNEILNPVKPKTDKVSVLHRHLQSRLITNNDNDIVVTYPDENADLNTLKDHLQTGYNSLEKDTNRSLCLKLSYGRLVSITHKKFKEEIVDGDWKEWAKAEINFCSISYLNKQKLLSDIVHNFSKIRKLKVSFNYLYSNRSTLKLMLNKYKSYWM